MFPEKTQMCSSTAAALPLCPGCTNSIFHQPKHSPMCWTNIYTWQEAVTVFSLSHSHFHTTIPSVKSPISPANHLLQAQELCLGEVYSSAAFTAFTSFLHPGRHTNPDRIFQAKAVHAIFQQPYLGNLFLRNHFSHESFCL